MQRLPAIKYQSVSFATVYDKEIYFSSFYLAFLCLKGSSQTCTTLGQTPSSAFPVCGTDTFLQRQCARMRRQ